MYKNQAHSSMLKHKKN